jgi:hypothetical protein
VSERPRFLSAASNLFIEMTILIIAKGLDCCDTINCLYSMLLIVVGLHEAKM